MLEIIDEDTTRIGKSVPLFLRISSVENTPDLNAGTIEDSIKLAEIVTEKGIDVIDVSSEGNDYKQMSRSGIKQELPLNVPQSKSIKEALVNMILLGAVGGLDADPVATNEYIEKGCYDMALIGKAFLRYPGLVHKFSDELGVKIYAFALYDLQFYLKRETILEVITRSEDLSLQDKE